MSKLYIRDNSGKLRFWSCYEVVGGIEIEHGVVGGASQFQFEEIEEGKGGRDVDEQIASRIESRTNKQLDKGYVRDIEVAKTMKPMNRLGFCKPMLAKKQEDVDIGLLRQKPFYIQYKLDGNRCLVHNDGTRLTAYTRNGKEFTTLDHILEPLKDIIPAGYTLDGELYIHGVSLQNIVSLVKRKQPGTEKVIYHVYDMISDDGFGSRYNELETILSDFKDNPTLPIKLVKTVRYEPYNPIDLGALLREARRLKYEGLMFRSDYKVVRGKMLETGYEDGKRSGSLVKFKVWESEEFEVINIKPSADGWAILTCSNPRGENFTVSCPGNMSFRRHVLDCKHLYIGKQVTLNFAYWTADGKPFHPTAVAFRDYE